MAGVLRYRRDTSSFLETLNTVLMHHPVQSLCRQTFVSPPTPQLGRYTRDGQLFLGPLGSTGDDTRCVVDDQLSSFPQLLNCDKVASLKQKTWHFSQVRGTLAGQSRGLSSPFCPFASCRWISSAGCRAIHCLTMSRKLQMSLSLLTVELAGAPTRSKTPRLMSFSVFAVQLISVFKLKNVVPLPLISVVMFFMIFLKACAQTRGRQQEFPV